MRSGPFETATTGTSWTPASSITSHTAESWPLPPSISSRSGHSPFERSGSSFSQPREAAAEHLAHHREIVAGHGLGPLDVELAIAVLAEALGPGDDHRADRVGAHHMAVVVDLDPLRRLGQLERVGDLAQVPALGRGLGEAAVQLLLGVARGLADHPAPVAALRSFDRDLAPGALGKASQSRSASGSARSVQDQPRRRHLLVELDEEALQHLGFGHVVGVGREEAAMAPILAAADEEGLDAHRPALAGEREQIGVAEPLGVDRLAALDVGERAQPVAIDRGQFEIHRLRRVGHRFDSLAWMLVDLPAEEILGVADQLGIAGLARSGRRKARCSGGSDRAGRAATRLAKKLSVQLRSRNSFCSALSVSRTEPALANGP